MDLLQLKELLTIVLCVSLFLLYAVDALLTATLVTLDVIPPKYLIRLYCIPAFVLTRFCFRFDTLSMGAMWASFNQSKPWLYLAALFGVFSAGQLTYSLTHLPTHLLTHLLTHLGQLLLQKTIAKND
jgi:hypothetical protein